MKIIGHRGALALSPENTVASLNKALFHHVDEIEIDVQITQDGVLVLHHDESLHDASGAEVSISDTAYAELLQHKPDLATLDMAIETINHRCPLIIEIKPGVPATPVISIIKHYLRHGWNIKEFQVASFDFKILKVVQAELPELGLIVNERWSGVRASWRARRLKTKRLSMNQLWLWQGFLAGMNRRGFEISPYTVNNPSRAERWSPYIYGVITDMPDVYEYRLEPKADKTSV